MLNASAPSLPPRQRPNHPSHLPDVLRSHPEPPLPPLPIRHAHLRGPRAPAVDQGHQRRAPRPPERRRTLRPLVRDVARAPGRFAAPARDGALARYQAKLNRAVMAANLLYVMTDVVREPGDKTDPKQDLAAIIADRVWSQRERLARGEGEEVAEAEIMLEAQVEFYARKTLARHTPWGCAGSCCPGPCDGHHGALQGHVRGDPAGRTNQDRRRPVHPDQRDRARSSRPRGGSSARSPSRLRRGRQKVHSQRSMISQT